ncbi:hypothetical protein PIB30_109200, partial [Stylosanthes scabra]|nr:hypothetical protein [Stylosanthes scabra]
MPQHTNVAKLKSFPSPMQSQSSSKKTPLRPSCQNDVLVLKGGLNIRLSSPVSIRFLQTPWEVAERGGLHQIVVVEGTAKVGVQLWVLLGVL